MIYLDFDGETVSGTNWNSLYNGGSDIVAGGSGFSNAEIQSIWETVSEDYAPFNVNITTDRTVFNAAATNRRVMVIFTPDNEWYGATGGVAFVNTFGSSYYDEPAWVFTDQLLYNSAPHAPYAAEAASHESGHSLGLSHDGDSGNEYYSGHGSGATSWAPIMGSAYTATVSQWSKGEYSRREQCRGRPGYHFGRPTTAWVIVPMTSRTQPEPLRQCQLSRMEVLA